MNKNNTVIFEELGEKKPGHFAVRQYRRYKLAAGVAENQVISCLDFS